ncbi:MAG: hypothetical protein RLZZ575_353, partial [Actinomycetota bacterium]
MTDFSFKADKLGNIDFKVKD